MQLCIATSLGGQDCLLEQQLPHCSKLKIYFFQYTVSTNMVSTNTVYIMWSACSWVLQQFKTVCCGSSDYIVQNPQSKTILYQAKCCGFPFCSLIVQYQVLLKMVDFWLDLFSFTVFHLWCSIFLLAVTLAASTQAIKSCQCILYTLSLDFIHLKLLYYFL